MKKAKLLGLSASLLLVSLAATGCGETGPKIGVLLPVQHDALQLCADGFEDGLKQAGLVKNKDFQIVSRNASGDDANLITFAKDLVGSCEMTFGLGTGASQALNSAATDKGSTKPILFSAVTDPVSANLVESLENGKGYVTGTSDAQPIDAQIKLVKECIPDADKIGILYTSSEVNSVVQADQAQQAAQSEGLTVVRKTVTGPTDISANALALASESGIDAIYIPTDNNLAANMNAVLQACNSKNVLVVAGEENMLKNGGHITLSVDYFELGVRTGKIAAQILKGEKAPKDIPVTSMTKEECEYLYSSANLAGTNIVLPDAVKAKCRDVSAN